MIGDEYDMDEMLERNEVYIDWDIKYDTFRGPNVVVFKMFNEFKEQVSKKYGRFVWWHRASSSGNTHLKLVFDNELEPIDNLMIRAILCDDYRRLVIDLKRMFKYGPEQINRLFDWKAKFEGGDVKTYEAGEWLLGGEVKYE